MSRTEKASKAKWSPIAPFVGAMRRRVYRPFLHQAKSAETELLSDHGGRLASALRTSLSEIARIRRLPADSEGIPLLYLLSESFLEENRGNLTQKALCEYLCLQARSFYDEELLCFPFLLTLAAVSLYIKTGEDTYLLSAARLEAFDFEEIFFTFSAAERIFLTEAKGIYLDSDTRTKHLYHARLRREARRLRRDPLAVARETVAAANKKSTHIGAILPPRRGKAGTLYFYFLATLTLSLTALYISLMNGRAPLLALLVILPVYAFAKELLPPFFERTGERILPRLGKGEALEKTGVLVAIMTLLFGEEKDAAIFDKLEDLYLTNSEGNHYFAVFCDLPSSKKRTSDGDGAAIAYARGRVNALRKKYGEHFALFVRERRHSKSEDSYIGWERKRGGVLELCRFLRGEQGGISVFEGACEGLRGVSYLLTLDADTNLYIGAVRELAGTMLHPENRPVIHKALGIVTAGHGILQPRMTTALHSASASRFAELTGGDGGIDIYAGCASDIYQQVFDEGIFCGKGILDIDTYLAVCDGFFPKERILSHDLAEGNLLRSALAADIVLTDSTPKTVLSYYTRAHRWLRGDLQMLPYLGNYVRDSQGSKRKNPMSRLSKYKILDNVLRAMAAPAALFALLLSLAFGRRAVWLTAAFSLFYIISPSMMGLLRFLWGKLRGFVGGQPVFSRLPRLSDTAAHALFRLSALAYESYLFMDAAIRTLYRFFVSHRNFLNWTTASEGDGRPSDGIDGVISSLWISPAAGLVLAVLPIPLFRILGALFLIFPFAMYALSKDRGQSGGLTERERREFSEDAHAAWLYFRDLVGEETNYLPPDNYQLSPVERVAMRTSPTNIGLYLLSALAARDRGFLTTKELYAYAEGTLRSLRKMLTWNGHYYNWYDIRTLKVIGEPFVSTVDSGNLVTSLVAFCEGLLEYVSEYPRLLDLVYAYEEIRDGADFTALYNEKRHLFYIGYDAANAKYSDSYYDTLMSESRTTSYFAVATRAVPREHYFALSRHGIPKGDMTGIASWSGTAFEYFMPALFLPTPKDSLAGRAMTFAYRAARRFAVSFFTPRRRRTVFGISESAYFAFDYEMNYQYRAFGIPRLAMDPCAERGRVIAPYASFLMVEWDPARVLANLDTLRTFSMWGRYGFYEAIDFDGARVGKGYAVIKSYMAHHLGMTIVAASNLTDGGIFRRRFMRSPKMRASRELLSEKVPALVRALPEKKRPAREELPQRQPQAAEAEMPSYEYGILTPEITLISNNKTKVFASSSGHILLSDGGDALCLTDFDRFSLGGGLRFYMVIDGVPFSAVPLGCEPQGFTASYSFTARDAYMEYGACHTDGKREYGVTLRLTVYPDREVILITANATGRYKRAHGFLYFEPIMEKRQAFEAHRSFSELFIESKYCADEEVLLFARRQRSEKKAKKYLGIAVSCGIDSFDTMRDAFLPLMATESDFAALSGRALSGSAGAVIIPAAAIRTGEIRPSNGQISFYLGYGRDSEELLYSLTKCRSEKKSGERKSRMDDVLRLQHFASGLDEGASYLERFVLRGFLFGAVGKGHTDRMADRGCLYRYGISGENAVMLALLSDDEEQKKRLRRLICLFKYMCIRGVRFDLLILHTETDGYHRPMRRFIERTVRQTGCENFLSFSGGIFPIGENTLAPAEKEMFSIFADVCFDLSLPIEVTASANLSYVPLSKAATESLLRGCETGIAEAPPPEITPIRSVLGGFFHENGFVIEKPHGAVPWAHIVSSERFGTVLTENSLGFTFSENAGLCKLTPHTADNMREDGGERLILRIYDAFDPSRFTDHDIAASAKYVNFAFGYGEYTGQAEGIFYRLRVSVLENTGGKRMDVFLEGGGTASRPICLCYRVVPCLGERREKRAHYRIRKENGAVYITRTVGGGVYGLCLSSSAPSGVFLGEAAFRSDGRIADVREDSAVLTSKTLLAGKWQTSFFLTEIRSETEVGDPMLLRLGEKTPVYRVPAALFTAVSIKTADPLFDEVVNKWTLYQTLYSRIFARCGFYQVSGAYGFRDQLQDALSMISVCPETAKSLILRAATRQYESGAVTHWWHEETKMGIMTRCSDDFLWLPYVTACYVEMTGDEEILDTVLPYLSSPPLSERENERYEPIREGRREESLLLHLCRAAENGMRRGAHGLPLMGGGDWNDGMNLVGIGGRGESVWLAFFTAIVLRRLIPILRRHGHLADAERYERECEALLGAAENAYDGAWYLRGYYDDGTPLGSAAREECKIDLLPQAFAAMAAEQKGEIPPRVKEAMASVRRLLFDREERLLRLLAPPFERDGQSPGYIKGYVAGIRENGGQYTHGAVFAALGFFAAGDPETAAEVLLAIHPAVRYASPQTAKKYKIEPYVLAGDVYANPSHMGRGGWSWYTGSAAWYRRAVTEVLCGYTERGDGFYLRPHLSDAFDRFEMTVEKRDTRYHITASLAEKGSLCFDGERYGGAAGDMFFPFDGGRHEIRLELQGAEKKKAVQD